MILLERKISEYTHHDTLLGIFENMDKANNAKGSYIKQCLKDDKWAQQAYKTVDLSKDIVLKEVTELVKGDPSKAIHELYVVSLFTEGFGQVVRSSERIFTQSSDAKEYVAKKEAEEPEYEPSWYETTALTMNQLYFDEEF